MNGVKVSLLVIPNNVVTTVCRHGQGVDQCRYLAKGIGHPFFHCLKSISPHKELIDGEVDAYKDALRSPGIPLGDNCEGLQFTRF